MKFSKKLISLFLAFSVAFISIFSVNVDKVHADTIQFAFENDQFGNHQNEITYTLTQLHLNHTIDLNDYYAFVSAYQNGSLFLLEKDTTTYSASPVPDFYNASRYFSIVYTSTGTATFRNTYSANVPLEDLASVDFNDISYNAGYKCDITLYQNQGGIGKVYDAVDSTAYKSYEFWQAAGIINYSLDLMPTIPPYLPAKPTFYTGMSLGINVTDFVNWLIDTGKASQIPAYIGSSKLASFISFYNDYGGSNTSFFDKIGGWFDYMNISNQTTDNINILKTTTDKLYQEYLAAYTKSSWDNSANIASGRKNISTNTTDSNTTLITDDTNDSLIEKILRDILRGVISIQNAVAEQTAAIVNAIKGINFTQTVVNNGGSGGGGDANVEGLDENLSDAIDGSFDQMPEIDKTMPDLLSAPAVLGSSVNIYISIFESLGIDKILLFAVLICFLIVKLRGNTR